MIPFWKDVFWSQRQSCTPLGWNLKNISYRPVLAMGNFSKSPVRAYTRCTGKVWYVQSSFVHMIMICWLQLRLTNWDKVPMFLYYYYQAYYYVLLILLRVKHTLLYSRRYYDACVNYAMQVFRYTSVSLMPIAAALIAENLSLLQL